MEKEKLKNFLKNNIWSNSDTAYYELQQVDDSLLKELPYSLMRPYIKGKKNFLDIGCGDAAKTREIAKVGKIGNVYGIDISEVAIKKAEANLPTGNFIVGDIEKLPYNDNFFDLVYSGFVLEHTVNPELVISEALRVLKKDGMLCLLCPNYGAPNRSSPCYKGSRINKLFLGFIRDFLPLNNLTWNFVTPLSKRNNKHIVDYDTTVEPYLLSLVRYIKNRGYFVVKTDSVWPLDDGKSFRHKLFKHFGELSIFPFKYWGPQVFVCIKK